jgi:hypothetical protein
MTTFPALIPSSRVFTPGEYPATAFNGYSGAQNRVRHSNVFLASQLRLTFKAASEADMLTIWRHYAGTQGSYESFLLPDEAFSGVSIADYVPSTYRWIYAAPGTVEDLPCGGHNISLTLESVPPPNASVIGVRLRIALGLVAGTGIGDADKSGISKTIDLALAAGIALDSQNGLNESIELTLTTGQALNTLPGLDKSIELVLNAGAAIGDVQVDGVTEAVDLVLVGGVAEEVADEPTTQYEVFLSSGTWDWTAAGSPSTVDVLLVAGGGGGGSRSGGGGGGAGGLRVVENVSVTGSVTVTVGNGGAGASNAALGQGSDGAASSFAAESAAGGGGGGAANSDTNADSNGRSGGSGGGGGRQDTANSSSGVASPSGQGNGGGIGGGGIAFGGGGGGGAGGAGGDREAAPNGLGGLGGLGIALESLGWTPESGPATVCIGGQGGRTSAATAGGQGGGGDAPTGSSGTNGASNTGGGGGGGGSPLSGVFGSGGSGGSGLVIVRWIA